MEGRHRDARSAEVAGHQRRRALAAQGRCDAYAYFLHRFTTTTRTAAEIHQIGLNQVRRIETRMDGLLRWLGPDRRLGQMGGKFSPWEYHSVLLRTCTVPLKLLERQVNGYVAAAGGKA